MIILAKPSPSEIKIASVLRQAGSFCPSKSIKTEPYFKIGFVKYLSVGQALCLHLACYCLSSLGVHVSQKRSPHLLMEVQGLDCKYLDCTEEFNAQGGIAAITMQL